MNNFGLKQSIFKPDATGIFKKTEMAKSITTNSGGYFDYKSFGCNVFEDRFKPSQTLPLPSSDETRSAGESPDPIYYVSKEKLRSIPLLEKKFHDDVALIRRQLADHYAVLFDLKPEFFVRLHLAKLLSDTAFDYISLSIHTVRERSCLLSDYLHRLDAEQAIQLMNIVSSYILRSGVVTLYEGVFSRIGLDPRKKIPPQPVYACCCCSDN